MQRSNPLLRPALLLAMTLLRAHAASGGSCGRDGEDGECPGEDSASGRPRLRIFQPELGRCCWGNAPSIRYQTFGQPGVPEVGLVVMHAAGWEEEVLVDKAQGELIPTVNEPGRYRFRVAIESHDRSQVLAEAFGVVWVHAHGGDAWAARGEDDKRSSSGEKSDPIVLHHALHPAPADARDACEISCLLTKTFDQEWIAATQRLTAQAAARGQGVPFFVQIGANHGTGSDEPLYQRIVEDAWHGVLVEPLPDIFARLQANHAGRAGLAFANVAVTDESAHAGDGCVMQRVAASAMQEGELAGWVDGLASFFPDRSVIAGVGGAWGAEAFDDFKEARVFEAVTCVTLPALLAAHGVQRLDVFVVDAEGYDARILAQLVNPSTLGSILGITGLLLEANKSFTIIFLRLVPLHRFEELSPPAPLSHFQK